MSKRLLVIVMSSLLLLGLSSLPAHAIPMVDLDLLDCDIYVGDSFDVQVLLDGDNIGQELLSFGFDVITTGSVFTYDSHVVGAGFDDDSNWVPPAVAGSAFPGIADDDVLLATLSFTALAEGMDTLLLQGVYDGMFSGLFYELTGESIFATLDISVGTRPIPEPATLLLFGIGIVGLAGAGARRKKNRKGTLRVTS